MGAAEVDFRGDFSGVNIGEEGTENVLIGGGGRFEGDTGYVELALECG